MGNQDEITNEHYDGKDSHLSDGIIRFENMAQRGIVDNEEEEDIRD